MRKTARWTAGGATLAFALLGSTAGVAYGAPASLYAPSALVLTTAHGESATTGPEHAVVLTCAPGATGTHPDSEGACAALAQVKGEFGSLAEISRGQPRFCTREYNPVTVTARGVWQGMRVNYEHTFANECVKNTEGAAVFAF
ncbi:subtilase-type protease inhibitor [Streptomyces sp. HNM0645]|uniref:subtilase-type protease inhibitor n=1 Tax=Streptomyces sp. HNM0645 TaxID=2782343 RepID=UPI0024B7F27A|nr:subtilase-type protease inhibitor [Streptomyces sp. HNM0645]MDI9888901.1 subtilase-type protease inhibitor [Streptomyces sp. HNM0645]